MFGQIIQANHLKEESSACFEATMNKTTVKEGNHLGVQDKTTNDRGKKTENAVRGFSKNDQRFSDISFLLQCHEMSAVNLTTMHVFSMKLYRLCHQMM
jgi:hypothetical protein